MHTRPTLACRLPHFSHNTASHLLCVDFKLIQKFLKTAHYHTFFKIYMTILRHLAASAVLRCLSCVLALMPSLCRPTDADDADCRWQLPIANLDCHFSILSLPMLLNVVYFDGIKKG
jgi:hypothetical protein